MPNLNFSLQKLRKPSQILRKTAEIIEDEAKRYPAGFYKGRDGACYALSYVEEEMLRAASGYSFISIFMDDSQREKAKQLTAKVNRARELFKEFYGYTDSGRARPKSSYWFGRKFTDKQQQHRIEALLMTAAIAEEMGE